MTVRILFQTKLTKIMKGREEKGELTKEMETMRDMLSEAQRYFCGHFEFQVRDLTLPPPSLRVRKADKKHVNDVKVRLNVPVSVSMTDCLIVNRHI